MLSQCSPIYTSKSILSFGVFTHNPVASKDKIDNNYACPKIFQNIKDISFFTEVSQMNLDIIKQPVYKTKNEQTRSIA